jgi:hypothetical protein
MVIYWESIQMWKREDVIASGISEHGQVRDRVG